MAAKSAKRLGQNMKRIRLEKGMTQDDICRKLGADRPYISKIENGKRNLTLANIERIATALGVSVDKLLK